MFIEEPATKYSIAARSHILGVGINDADYMTNPTINGKHVMCPYYAKWQSMLERCYSDRYQTRQPTYIGCSVCEEWLTFSNFKEWMVKQDWQGKQLDKDIIKSGNRIYSPSTCLFVTHQINTLLGSLDKGKGKYPKGICYDRSRGKFVAQCCINKKQHNLGRFDTLNQATSAYRSFKSKMLLSVAKEQNQPLKNYLIRISKEYNS